MASDQQRLAVLNSNDTAFKRFSFTGINVTPAMISNQAAETVRNVDVSAQSSSMRKDPISPQRSTLHQEKPPSTSSSSSVVMSKIGNGGSSRGFALARMTRPNVSQSQPNANHTAPQQSQHSPIDQPIKWPTGMAPPTSSRSTGELEGKPSSPSHQASQHLSNGDIGSSSELPGGFQAHLQQSFSNPNISTHSEANGQPLVGLTNVSLKDSQVTSSMPSAMISNAPQRPLSASMSRDFEYSPVPRSVANRRSPVPEQQVHYPPGPQETSTGLYQPVVTRDQKSKSNSSNTEAPRYVKSTPSTPNKTSSRKPVVTTSKSTPNSPTKHPPGHVQQPGYDQQPTGNIQLQRSQNHQPAPPESHPDHETRIGLPQFVVNHQDVSTDRLVNNIGPGQHHGSVQSGIASEAMVNSQGSRNSFPGTESLSNGIEQVDGRQQRPHSVVDEMMQINTDPVVNSNEHWSLPSIEQRRRMGVIETSL